jgi:hypothetical protein
MGRDFMCNTVNGRVSATDTALLEQMLNKTDLLNHYDACIALKMTEWTERMRYLFYCLVLL